MQSNHMKIFIMIDKAISNVIFWSIILFTIYGIYQTILTRDYSFQMPAIRPEELESYYSSK